MHYSSYCSSDWKNTVMTLLAQSNSLEQRSYISADVLIVSQRIYICLPCSKNKKYRECNVLQSIFRVTIVWIVIIPTGITILPELAHGKVIGKTNLRWIINSTWGSLRSTSLLGIQHSILRFYTCGHYISSWENQLNKTKLSINQKYPLLRN